MTKGGGEYRTTRDALERAGHIVPDYSPSPEHRHIIVWFWELKRFCKSIDDPLMPNMIADYCECQSVLISRPERAIIYAMDYALRNALVSERAKNDRTIRKKQAKK